MKRKTKIFFIIVVILISLYLVIFPIQKLLAIRKFNSYIIKQGVNIELITKKDVFWDLNDGRYEIYVTYADDPDYSYFYCYNYYTHKKNQPIKFDVMTLEVIDESDPAGSVNTDCNRCKYHRVYE